ncbi:MAG: hypothetical protein KAS49_04550, partial [Candidatus Cloacimonetes bacterium]|nr:hypothetical protein [Candidatus Cloacimonadota bacterium]
VGNDVYSKDVAEFESEVRHARGVCYAYYPEKGYGFMRFLKKLGSGLWITDSRRSESPYATAFVHSSHFPENFDARTLPNREQIFEFDVRKVPEKGYQAENVKIIYNY